MTEYDDSKPIPPSKPSSKVEPIIAVCVGGPHHNANLTFYPSEPYTGQQIVSRYTEGEYTYNPESDEWAAHFMWRDYEDA